MERLKTLAIAALLVALAGSITLAVSGGEAEVRINARQLADGRVEFALQQRTDGEWGERILPRSRYFPAEPTHNRWLNSSPLTVSVAVAEESEAPTVTTTPETTDSNAFTAISAGRKYTCAIRSANGAIECWGSNTTTKASEETATGRARVYSGQASPPEGKFRAVSAGSDHTCAIRENKTITCWGTNDYGQSRAPTGSFTAISVDGNHSCAIRDTGEIACWGDNFYGQSDAPAGSFTTVSVGSNHTCAIRSVDDVVACWGWNALGQSDAPAGSFRVISAGLWHHCGLRADGAIECWGANALGQSRASDGRYTSDEVAAFARIVGQSHAPDGRYNSVSVGLTHSCGLRESGEITCWGRNDKGQASPPAGSFTAVSAGSWHTCGLRADGAVECWGWNDEGQTDVPTE